MDMGQGQGEDTPSREKAQRVTAKMGDLKMRSPEQIQAQGKAGVNGQHGVGESFRDSERDDAAAGRVMPDRKYTSSTDSESSFHPQVPSQSGSMYNSDGFPKPFSFYGPTGSAVRTDSPDASMMPAAHAAVSAADEAIKQLNGTAATVYGGTPYSGFPPPLDNPYQLPRGFAGFVKPQQGYRNAEPGVTRQSSMSSSTTEASTSSEEEDLTLPSVMWLPSTKDREREEGPNAAATSWLYAGKPQKQSASRTNRGGSPYGGRTSPEKMPPPPLHRVQSPHFRPGSAGTSSFPHAPTYQAYNPGSASAAGPGNSALPIGMSPSAPDVDDDGTTVGAPEQVSSASSISASSGLDLLWRAATHDHTDSPGDDHSAGIKSPRGEGEDRGLDSKGKRKAGAEAVAQWRQSGIPLGVGVGVGAGASEIERRRRESTNSTDADEHSGPGGEVIMSPPPHKKRRKSSAQTDLDKVKKEGRTSSCASQGRTSGTVYVPPPSSSTGAGPSGRRSPSTDADANGDAEWESQSDDDDDSEAGSDYAASSNPRGAHGHAAAAGAASSSGRIRKPSAKMKLATAHAASGGAGPSSKRASGGGSGSRGGKSAGKASAGRKGSASAAGGGAKKVAPASGGGSGGAGGSGGSVPPGRDGKVHVPAGGVRCDYHNPLPVSDHSLQAACRVRNATKCGPSAD